MRISTQYFDYAAATPMSPAVRVAIEPYFSDVFYNPSASYLAAQSVRKVIDDARANVAMVLGARPQEITFTAGGTEANNLAIQGVMRSFPNGNCVVSTVEHDAVLEPAARFERKLAPVDAQGRINVDALRQLIDDKTVLVSVMYANNEIGTIQPLSVISTVLKEVRWNRTKSGNKLPIYFHTDACQAPNYLKLLVNTLGVDMMTLNGGKIYGPKQSGALYVKRLTEMTPLIYGGGQEKGGRSGTENVAGIVGFAMALTEATAMREVESDRLANILQKARTYIEKELPQAVINGSIAYHIPNNLHITFPGVDNERLMVELDEKGFQVAVGSACSASSGAPSHVLKAIGLSDEAARASLRITIGRGSTEAGLIELLQTCKLLVLK